MSTANTGTALQLFSQFEDDSKFNILRPTQAVMAAQNPLMTVYANVVKFDVEADSYPVDGGKRALFGRALSQVASGAGISFVNVSRLDDQRDSAVANVSVLAMMKRPDGTMIHTTGQKRVDARAYAEQKYGKDFMNDPKGKPFFHQLVKFVAERAETGAKSRAIRQLLAMKAAYTPQELAKPFVIPQIVVNMAAIVSTEFGMRLAIEQALGATSMMYGGQHSGNGNTPGMALPAHPASDAVETPQGDPASQPGAQGNGAPSGNGNGAGPTADEILIDEWTVAGAAERLRKLESLLAEREHGLTEGQAKAAMNGDAAKQAKAIVWLLARPVKAAQPGMKWAPSEKQIARLYGIAKNSGRDDAALHEAIAAQCGGITSVKDLTKEQYDMLCGSDTDAGWLALNPHRAPRPGSDPDLDSLPF